MSQYKRDTSQRKRLRTHYKSVQAACYICGKPIDYELKTPHPDSFELDHVQALARGGADTPSNLRPSHRHCNSAKRTRAHAPIVRRSGALD